MTTLICKLYIYVFCLYISFETIILNVLPTSVIGIVRYGTEVLGYVALLIIVILRRGKIEIRKSEKNILFFFLIVIVNIFVNMVDAKIAILGMRWIMRYLYIYFMIYLSGWSKKDINNFLHLIKVIMIIEIGLSVFQLLARDLADMFLLPHYGSIIDGINAYSLQGESQYAIFASFGRYGEFGYFITFALWIWFAEYCSAETFKSKSISRYMIITWLVLLLLSYCRQEIVAIMIGILFFIIAYKNLKFTKKQTTFLIIGLAILLPMTMVFISSFESGRGTINEGIAQRFFSVFSKEFIMLDYLGKGRTWFYTTGLFKLLSHKPLLGFGIGRYGCQTAIQYDDSVHQLLNIPTRFSMDVYVVSIIGQLGLVGVFALGRVYFNSIKSSKKMFCSEKYDRFSKKISMITYGLCISSIVLTLFSSSLSDRYLAFYLWTMMAFQRTLKVEGE